MGFYFFMKEIKLGRSNLVALVDDEDYERVNAIKWHVHKKDNINYAINRLYISDRKENGLKKSTKVSLHRYILGINDKTVFVDHKDHNGLNNTRNNLRIATPHENNRNTRKMVNCSSIYKGVSWLPCRNRWKASIYINKKNKQIGLFKNELDAGKAYDKMAKIHFGEFAFLNFKE